MSWWNSGHEKQEGILKNLLLQFIEIRKQLSGINYRMDEMMKREQQRFDTLLQQFINLAAQKNAPLSPGIPPDPLASLGLFEEVPVGDKSGYNSAELSLGAEYAEEMNSES